MENKLIAPNQMGYLVIKDDGAILESGGEMKNDERSANIIMGLINLTESIDENFMPNNSCERISIDYDHHYYNICMSNRRIYVVKLRKTNDSNSINGSSSASTSVYNDAEGSGSTALA